MKNIALLVSTFIANDAIGNDVTHQYNLLKKTCKVDIYAQNSLVKDEALKFINKEELFDFIEDKNNIIIYHHGVFWPEGQEILKAAKCRIFLKYHNITSPCFFQLYNNDYMQMCKNGIAQTAEIVNLEKVEKYICDSLYNSQDFLALGVPKTKIKIAAPFHNLNDFKKTKHDMTLANQIKSNGKINILFIGRFAPNKGHRHLVQTIMHYTRIYDREISLDIIGGLDDKLSDYTDEIKTLINYYKLNDCITIHNKLSFDKLCTYLNYSDIFLLLSEHEGFCVPILEAQMHDMPIIAYNSTAVGETLGEEQLIFDTLDYHTFAVAIHLLSQNQAYKNYLIDKGRKNFENYSNDILEKNFLDCIK